MSANFISQPIPVLFPSDAMLLVTRDDAAGTVNIAIGVGQKLTTFKLGVAGWRGLSTALGVPPDAAFTPYVRQCRVCGKTDAEIQAWAAANLCACCLGLPIKPTTGQGRRHP